MSWAAKFVPFADRVLVKKITQTAKTVSGIMLPESAAPKLNQAEIIAVGPGRYLTNGQFMASTLKKGDKVLLPSYGGTEIQLNNEEYIIYNHGDILAKFN
ncbi:hypothetical protein WA158_007324 [Blastocystis sp. Blastoise]